MWAVSGQWVDWDSPFTGDKVRVPDFIAPGLVVAGGGTGHWSLHSYSWLFAESLVCRLLCSALDVLHRNLGCFPFTTKGREQVKCGALGPCP